MTEPTNGEEGPLAERIAGYLWGYDGHEEQVPWDSLAEDSFDRRAYVKKAEGVIDEFGITAPDQDVRNVTIWTGLCFDAMDTACREQGQDGFALVRIVPYTNSQVVAVFERRRYDNGGSRQ